MIFETILIFVLGLMCSLVLLIFLGWTLTPVGKILIAYWFKEREAYVKRMSMLTEHEREYESHVN